MELISKKTLGSLQVWVTLGHCGALCYKGTDGLPYKLDFSLSSVIITESRSEQFILGHCNENPVVLKHNKCINNKI